MRLLPKTGLKPAWTPKRPLLLLYGLMMAAVLPGFLTRKTCDWDFCYVATANRLIAGLDIYGDQATGFVYPPFQAVLALPVIGLPPLAQRGVWFAVNAWLLWYVLKAAWRLAGGPDLERERCGRNEYIAAGLGLIVGMTYFLNTLMHHQTDIVLAALVFKGLESMRDGRGLIAGIAFGAAAAIKCTPLLFLPWLLFRKRFLTALAMMATVIACSVLPDLIASPTDASTWLAKWLRIFILPMFEADHRPGVWASGVVFNQSFFGAVNRWTTTSWALNPGFECFYSAPLIGPGLSKAILLALALVCGIVSLCSIVKRREIGLEGSLVVCGMLLFSPMSSPAHFGLLVLPAFLLARAGSRWWLGIMLAMAAISNKDLLGANLYSMGLWYGSVMTAAVAGLIGTWRLLAASPRKCG